MQVQVCSCSQSSHLWLAQFSVFDTTHATLQINLIHMCVKFSLSLSVFIAKNALYPYAQLVAAWHSFYLKVGKPLKSLRLFRTAPWSGYKLKLQIQPSILWDNSNIIPEEFQILPSTCEPLSLVSGQNPYLADHHVFLQLLDHLFLKHIFNKGSNNNKVVIRQPYLVSCQNVFWCELSNFCSVETFLHRLYLYESQNVWLFCSGHHFQSHGLGTVWFRC